MIVPGFRHQLTVFLAALTTMGSSFGYGPDSTHRSAVGAGQPTKPWMEEADSLAARGNLGPAIELWRKAEAQCKDSADAHGQMDALLKLTAAYQSLGHRQEAQAAARRALALARASGVADFEQAAECALGVVLETGQPTEAAECLNRALQLAIQSSDREAEARIRNNLGNLESGQGRYQEALTEYRKSAALSRGTDADAEALALLNASQCAVQSGNVTEAGSLLDLATAKLAPLGSTTRAARLWIKAGMVCFELRSPGVEAGKRIAEADQRLGRAQAISVELGDRRTASWALGQRGDVCRQSGRINEGLQFTREAIFHAQAVGATELLYRWEWQAGRLHRQSGDVTAALTAYRRAVQTLENGALRHDIALTSIRREGPSGFRNHLGPLFYELADLLLQSATGLPEGTARQNRLVEARNAVELLKSAELDDYFKDPCQSVARGKIRNVDSISPRTAVIYPIALEDRLELLVSLPGSELERIQVPVGRAELERVVRDLQDKLRTKTIFEFAEPAEQLHQWLMTDLDPRLRAHGVDTLVFVPDGALRMIPMGALYDGTNFLAERYALAVSPGLTLMDPQPPQWKKPRLLVGGLSESRLGFIALPEVDNELVAVNSTFGGAMLKNKSFTAHDLEVELGRGRFSIVHLATHGQFQGNAANSFLLMFDQKLSLDAVESLVRPSQFRGQPLELLTLSACQTAVGNDRAALGLAGVAIKAGARSAMATLWCVNDEATATVTRQFYEEIHNHPGVSKARALQLAQIRLIKDPNYGHPYYWSPFLIVGNWL